MKQKYMKMNHSVFSLSHGFCSFISGQFDNLIFNGFPRNICFIEFDRIQGCLHSGCGEAKTQKCRPESGQYWLHNVRASYCVNAERHGYLDTPHDVETSKYQFLSNISTFYLQVIEILPFETSVTVWFAGNDHGSWVDLKVEMIPPEKTQPYYFYPWVFGSQTLSILDTVTVVPEATSFIKYISELGAKYMLWPVVTSRLNVIARFGVKVLAHSRFAFRDLNTVLALEWSDVFDMSPERPHFCMSTFGVPSILKIVSFVPGVMIPTSPQLRITLRIFVVPQFLVTTAPKTGKHCRRRTTRGEIPLLNCTLEYNSISYTVQTFNKIDKYCTDYTQNMISWNKASKSCMQLNGYLPFLKSKSQTGAFVKMMIDLESLLGVSAEVLDKVFVDFFFEVMFCFCWNKLMVKAVFFQNKM